MTAMYHGQDKKDRALAEGIVIKSKEYLSSFENDEDVDPSVGHTIRDIDYKQAFLEQV
jgi:hypothetical protein